MSSISTGVMEDTSKYGTLLTRLFFGEILPACTKEYLTAATSYWQVEVKISGGGRHFPARFL